MQKDFVIHDKSCFQAIFTTTNSSSTPGLCLADCCPFPITDDPQTNQV